MGKSFNLKLIEILCTEKYEDRDMVHTFCLSVVMKDLLWDFFRTPLELCKKGRAHSET